MEMDLVAIPFILVLAYFTFTWLCSVIEGLHEPEKLINDREIGSYRTLEEAKSMAQRDHERRSK